MADDFVLDVNADTSGLDSGLREVFGLLQKINGEAQKIGESFSGSPRSLAPLLVQMKELQGQLRDAQQAKDEAGIARAQQLLSNVNQSLNEIRQIRDEVRSNSFDRARVRDAQLATSTGDGRTVGTAIAQDRGLKDAVTVRDTTSQNLLLRLTEALDRISRREATYGTAGYSDASRLRAGVTAARLTSQYGGFASVDDYLAAESARKRATEEERAAERVFNLRRRLTAQQLKEEETARKEAARAEEKQQRDLAAQAKQAAREVEAERKRAQREEYNSLPNRVARGNEYREALISSNGGADLFAFQSRLAVNYQIFAQVASGIRSAVTSLLEFDDVLGRFAGITETSNTEMTKFRQGLLEIGSASRFTVKELADVAIVLGQTGMSASDVLKTLPAVRDLAAASGSTLQQAGDAITSAMGSFNISSQRSTEIADVMVGALNKTKLGMEQLQLGIQYAANTSRDAGISFSEMTAAIGSMAQAGIKSGSTIGTGLRSFTTELLSPTEKFKNVLKELGITLDMIDLKSNTLTGVLENLRKGGFSTTDAFRALDIRAAAAFAALVGQADRMKRLHEELLLSSASTEAASKANNTLTASLNQLSNSVFSLIDKAFTPFVIAAKLITTTVNGLVGSLGPLTAILPIVGSGIAGIAVALGTIKIGGLLAGLASIPSLVGVLANPAVLAVGAGAAALAGLGGLLSMVDSAADKLDRLKATSNELTSSQSSTETTIKSMNGQIESLLDRRDKLNNDPLLRRNAVLEAMRAFGDLGLGIKSTSASVDELVAALQRLREGMNQRLSVNLSEQLVVLNEQLKALKEKADEDRKTGFLQRIFSPNNRTRYTNMLGAEFGAIYDATRDYGGFDPRDPTGKITEYQSQISTREAAIQSRLRQLGIEKEQGKGGWSRDLEADKLEQQLVVLRELKELFKVTSDNLKAQASNTIARERISISQRALDLRGDAGFVALQNSAETTRGSYDYEAQKILANRGLGGTAQRDALVGLLEQRKAYGSQQLINLEGLRARMIADGASPEAVAEATADLADKLNSFLRSVTNELAEVSKSVNQEATRSLQGSRRRVEGQVTELMKRIGTETNPARQQELIEALKAKQDEMEKISIDLILTELVNPNDLEKHPELKARIEEAKERVRAEFAARIEQTGTMAKNLAKAILGDQVEDKNREVNALNRRRAELDAALKDPNVTPERAKELGATLKELIEQIRQAKGEVEKLKEQKDFVDRSNPGAVGSTIDIASRDLPPVLQALLKGIASVEASGYNVRNGNSTFDNTGGHPGRHFGEGGTSSASGLYQFIYGTWLKANGGVNAPMTPANQDAAALKLAMDRLRVGSIEELTAVLQKEGLSDRVMALLGPEWEGLKKDPGKARATFRRAQSQSDAQDGLDAERRQGIESVDRQQAEIERRTKLAALLRDDRAGAAELAADQSALRRSVDANQASAANSRVMQDILDAYKRAQEREAQSRDGRSEADKEEGRQAVRGRYLEQAQSLALSGAETVGKKVLDQYDQQISLLQARIKTMELPENAGKISQADLDRLKEALRITQERRAVEGELEANKRQIVELEKALEILSKAGLGDSKEFLKIQEQIEALRRRQGPLQSSVAANSNYKDQSPSYDKVLSNGLIDFGKSRGITSPLGKLVDDTEVARKALADGLGAIANGFDKLFYDLATGAVKGKEAFKSFATGILQDMARIASKAVSNEIMKMIFGSMLGSGGSDSFSVIGSLASVFGLGKATGGPIPMNLGVPGRDSVPTMLTPGEYVIKQSTAAILGRNNLDRINMMGAAAFNDNAPRPIVMGGGKAQATSNVYIMQKDTPPPLGPNDIVAVVGDNISRSGALYQLVKSVTAR